MERKQTRVPGSLERKTLAYLCRLARISLTEDEKELLHRDLSSILAYMERLNELDTTRVAPMTHAASTPTTLRDDRVEPSVPRDLALREAPEVLDNHFGVPVVVDLIGQGPVERKLEQRKPEQRTPGDRQRTREGPV